MKRKASMAELTRLRKQFNKMETSLITTKTKSVDTIAESFVAYLNASFS